MLNIIDHGSNNKVLGEAEVIKAGKVIFVGDNNTLVLSDNVTFHRGTFKFKSDNAYVEIGNNTKLNGDYILEKDCKITIGSNTKFNSTLSRLHCGEANTKIHIGSNCLIADVRFRTSDQHSLLDLDSMQRLNCAEDIFISDNVWLAENVYIYKGSIVEAGSVIGAGSGVFSTLPSNSLCVGFPAKPIRHNITWREELI